MATPHRRIWLWLLGALGLIGLVIGFAAFSAPSQPGISQPSPVPGGLQTATPPPPVPMTATAVVAAPSPSPPAQDLPTPTPLSILFSGTYTIAQGDTLWSVAVRSGLSLDQLVAANPGLNPDLVQPGQVIQIPGPGEILPTAPASGSATSNPSGAFQPNAQVKADANNLRLRAQPSSDGAILTRLVSQTEVLVTSRTSDGAWLQVTLADGRQGWAMAQFIDGPNDNALPALPTVVATSATTPAPLSLPTPAPTPAPTALTELDVRPGNPLPLSTAGLPRPEPYLQNFTTRAIEIYRAGLRMGNQANVFTLVGDSNTANPAFFEAFDAGNYNLDQYGYLQDTLRYYQGNFKLTSVAAVGGFNTTRLWEPERADPARCLAGEGSLACEYRIKKPSVALILIGSNDRPLWREFEGNYRQIIEYTISHGILPVLITKGDDTETQYGGPSGHINAVIRQLSHEYAVPLLDLRQAIDQFQLPNTGLDPDNLHFNAPPDGLSTHFNPEHLRYGYTLRNLTALQMLDAVRRLIVGA